MDQDKGELTQFAPNPIAQDLIHHLKEDMEYKQEEFSQKYNDLINNSSKLDSYQQALTISLFQRGYKDKLTPEQIEKLGDKYTDLVFNNPTNSKLQVFNQWMNNISNTEMYMDLAQPIEKHRFIHIPFNLISDPFAKLVLEVECRLLVKQITQKLNPNGENPSIVAEYFSDPETTSGGVWLSKYGEHLDINLIKQAAGNY